MSSPRCSLSRRSFLRLTLAGGIAPFISRGQGAEEILGQGEFRYRVVPGWGELGLETPVKNCHGIVRDREGHVILLTDHTKNNFIVYDTNGRLVHKWGTAFPGAHGLSIVTEGQREVLYFTDLQRHIVFKATTGGEMLGEWRWPESTGKYTKEDEYRPSWTLHLSDGGFFVLDGYGRDYITRYGADGRLAGIFGGQEGGIVHWGPHGGMIDQRPGTERTLLIAMSDQQNLLRLDLEGRKLGQIALPGGNPRQIRKHRGHYFVAHLADNWPADRNSRGFLSVLDEELNVISNVAGSPPVYADDGKLTKMRSQQPVFLHPHDLVVDDEDSIYVAQFASDQTYPIKLQRV
jgi:peptidylamidoglycolate lyase